MHSLLTWFYCFYTYHFSFQYWSCICFCLLHTKVEPIDLSNIPEEYHEFQDVFSKAKAGNLVPHCSYDIKIDLEENAQPPIRRMYPLSEHELEVLRMFLDENLQMNLVCPSCSAHRALILFIKKIPLWTTPHVLSLLIYTHMPIWYFTLCSSLPFFWTCSIWNTVLVYIPTCVYL